MTNLAPDRTERNGNGARIDVAFVVMPYGALEHPSIGVGLLKAQLARAEISSKVFYEIFPFAEQIGIRPYLYLANSNPVQQLGEWTFSGACFPGFDPDHDAFFKLGDPGISKARLWEIRRNVPEYIEQSVDRVLRHHPRVVGCPSTFQQNMASLAFLRRLKERDPSVVTVMGGANCEGPLAKAMVDLFPWLDLVVSGEADHVIAPLCRSLLDHRGDVSAIELPAGVARRARDVFDACGCHDSPKRLLIQDLDSLPLPDYYDYFERFGDSSFSRRLRTGITVESSRGCWWGEKIACTFCGLNGEGMEYRRKTPDRFVDEVRELARRHNNNFFECVDNILSTDYFDTALRSFAEGKEKFFFLYETKSNLTKEQVRRLSDSGAHWIQPGIESLSDRLLKLVHKGVTTAQNVQTMKWAMKFGVNLAWNFLANIPGERDEDYAAIANWMPLIFHLQPPTGGPQTTEIRYDVFSEYFKRGKDYGLEFEPYPAYRYIYPFAEEHLKRLVFFWRAQPHCAPTTEGPGITEVRRQILYWKCLHWSQDPRFAVRPSLRAKEMADGSLFVRDTRPCRLVDEQEIHGLEAELLVACDDAKNMPQILACLAPRHPEITEAQVTDVIVQLQEKRLLMRFKNRMLSLPIFGEIRVPPNFSNSPIGYLIPDEEVFDPAKQTLKQLFSLSAA